MPASVIIGLPKESSGSSGKHHHVQDGKSIELKLENAILQNRELMIRKIHPEPVKPTDRQALYDALLSISSCYTGDESSCSGGEPDSRDSITVSRLNPDHHPTNLPSEYTDSQDSQPVAVINPLNLQQAASEHPAKSTEVIPFSQAVNEPTLMFTENDKKI